MLGETDSYQAALKKLGWSFVFACPNYAVVRRDKTGVEVMVAGVTQRGWRREWAAVYEIIFVMSE
jgi:hypothetical protein